MPLLVRINDLARELAVKSKAVLDVLPVVGITEKKTHSSSLSIEQAEKVRWHFKTRASLTNPDTRGQRAVPHELKTKIDLSHISKPGDVLKAIFQKDKAVPAHATHSELPVNLPEAWRPVPGQPIYRRKSSTLPRVEYSPTAEIARRVTVPQTGERPLHTTKATLNGLKLKASPMAPEYRSPRRGAIEQAEEALKALRMQEKKGGGEL